MKVKAILRTVLMVILASKLSTQLRTSSTFSPVRFPVLKIIGLIFEKVIFAYENSAKTISVLCDSADESVDPAKKYIVREENSEYIQQRCIIFAQKKSVPIKQPDADGDLHQSQEILNL